MRPVRLSWRAPAGARRSRLASFINCLGLAAVISAVPGVGARAQVLDSLRVEPRYFSPNGDSVQDEASLLFVVGAPSAWVRVEVHGAGAQADTLRDDTLSAGSDTVTWNGSMGPGPAFECEYWFFWQAEDLGSEDSAGPDSLPVTLDITPPALLDYEVELGDSILHDGDSVRIRLEWDEAGYLVEADFSALDSDTTSSPLIADSAETTWVHYAISPGNTNPDGSSLPVVMTATDSAGNSLISEDVRFCLASVPPPVVLAIAVCDSPTAPNYTPTFARGDTICLEILFSTLSDTMTLEADFDTLDSNFDALDSSACFLSNPGEITCRAFYYHSGDSSISDGTYTLGLAGRDRGCQRADTTITVNYDGSAPQVDTLIVPDTCFVYGQTVEIYIDWSEPPADTAADFSAFTTEGTRTYNVRDWNGLFLFEYTIPDSAQGNRREDGCGIPVHVTAFDSVGNFFTRSIELCLSNYDPSFVSSAPPDSGRSAYHNDEEIRIVTYWDTSVLPDTVRGDFSEIDSEWLPRAVRSFRDEGGRFIVRYTIGEDNTVGDGEYPVILYAQDGDCGQAETIIHLTLDNTRPTAAPLLDALPAYWRQSDLSVTGRITGEPDSLPRVVLELNQVATDTVQVAADSSFAAQVTLQAGENHLAAYGMDEAGNRTELAAEADVFLLGAPFVTVPHRLRPDERFQIGLAREASGLNLEIRNLAGELVRRWQERETTELFDIEWDGRNGIGETVMSGPYLAVIEITYPDGARERHVKPFIFSRR